MFFNSNKIIGDTFLILFNSHISEKQVKKINCQWLECFFILMIGGIFEDSGKICTFLTAVSFLQDPWYPEVSSNG